ncbi:P-loop containing nucleoside triphosphate hydrolase protein [Zychaea mexicana]|uniref:P-loop containing nucleoside triphosphate hydrolase protein n=1 Tax=Zychaea mexicana TaxID=64656 RepID=UPI0022FF0471|nr:P-loop containing nucleoside triphosphate hydrolase protein [Zychaea mexicana]KAI9488412.1 P-loop containing nucleoside triphosphate hydrolase protein [Zychaea mexicana]
MTMDALSAPVQQAVEVYTKGIKAWIKDDAEDGEAWISATVLSKEVTDTGVKIVFQNDEDESRDHVYESSLKLLEKTQGADLPPLRNPPKMENTDDLTNLSYLNEPSVLNTIRTRYMQHNIYTYSGIVLIAANPFARVQLYEPDIIQQYSGRRRGELEPHLFAIAEDAYRQMIREQQNQTIVVSGESGAGKTVSAKYIMRYFATADDKEAVSKTVKMTAGGMTEVEEQILATNPIMEAFGNAKTTRNDNSSRFGKYIEIQFDKKCNIVGAKIRTYLLERSRLIFQPETERNYHIFYQLCAGIPLSERKEFDLKDWTKFHYLNQSGTGIVPGVNDAEEFELTKNSLSMVGISLQTQWQIFRLLAALLHIGNIEIGGRGDTAALSDSEPALMTATKLLGIKTSEFRKWLIKRQIVTRSDKIVKNLSPAQATVVRDSVAKYVYANLFEWLVSVVNESLSCQEPDLVNTFIGVLDIYGFEHFKKNSFEQFCINYANEKLQQQEYVKEQIDWQFIEFSDNQRCIEMIEARMGILSLLDEESRLPSGTDQGFCDKLFANFADPTYKGYFKKPRFSNSAFTVVHYAHEVQYEAEGFIDKNKDTVPDEHLTLLQNAESGFLVEMLQTATAAAAEAAKESAPPAKSLSLISLMDTIGQTNVHYIRCIKPNEAKVQWVFEPNMVLAQLRACGVLETIRISCAGYPSRWAFEDFADRYYALVSSEYWDPNKSPDIQKLCHVILEQSIKDSDKYQIGLTKIFFRAGQLAYMEKLRADRWNECVVLLQKNMRRFITRIRYLRTKDLALRLQQVARKKMGQRQLELLRQERAVITIQKYARGFLARKQLERRRNFVTHLQAACRSLLARKSFGSFRENNAATQIQRLVRGWMTRKRYLAQRDHIIAVQTCVRRRQARKMLASLRQEARSATHLKEVSYKLENKVVELTQNLTQQKDEKKALQKQATQLENEIQSWKDKHGKLEAKMQRLAHGSSTAQEELEALRSAHTTLQQEHEETVAKVAEQDKEIARLSAEVTRLRQQPPLKVSTQPTPKDEDVAELKNQIAALKAQLAQSLKNGGPRRQASLNAYGRNLSPSRMSPTTPGGGNSRRGISPERVSPRGRSPTGANMAPFRRNSLTESKPIVYAEPDQIRPMSIDHIESLRDVNGNPEEAIIPPNTQNPPSHKEVVFPAHIIGLGVTQMWRFGYLAESERLIFTVMDTVQKHCLSFGGEDTIIPCAFWLSNTHELLSLVCSTEQELEREMHYNSVNGRRAVGWHDFEKLVSTVKFELQCLEDNLYHHWLTELKQKLSKMAVPAIIESQSLPGFIATDNNRFFNKILTGGSNQPAFSMDDLLNFLNRVYRAMKCYDVEPFVMEQGLTELLKLIGVTAFNDLVMRRNFNSWKRAMQIQYNITRLEEWCKLHEMGEATLQLEHLMQAAKLLQLKKSSLEDIKIIYDVCWLLTPTQVQKLIQNYNVADYEDPISNDILRAVASRVSSSDSNDILLLDNVSLDDSPYEVPEPQLVVANMYLPSYLKLKLLQRLMGLMQLANQNRQYQRQDSL